MNPDWKQTGRSLYPIGRSLGLTSLAEIESTTVWNWWTQWCPSVRVQMLSSGLVTDTVPLESDNWVSVGFMLPSLRLGFHPSHKDSTRLWRLRLQTLSPCQWVQLLLLNPALGLYPRLWAPILVISHEISKKNSKDIIGRTSTNKNSVLVIFFLYNQLHLSNLRQYLFIS